MYPQGEVRRYGAVGDGTTNDAPAIQNAINAAPANAAVFLPPNASSQFYKLNSGLTITKPIRFIGSHFEPNARSERAETSEPL
jgi:hypothetical protein